MSSSPRIWFDVGFLIEHFTWDKRANGIQRVGLEVARAARETYGSRVTFCRLVLNAYDARFEIVDFARLEAACAGADFIEPGWPRVAAWVIKAARDSVSFLAHVAGRGGRGDMPEMAAGDVFLCLGTYWTEPVYRAWLEAAKRRRGLRVAALIHDVIPYSHPELAAPVFVRDFTRGFEAAIALCDLVLVYSEFSAGTIRELCRDKGWPVPPIARIHFGAGFVSAASGRTAPLTALPPSFVLFVSSIEGLRKNHILLVRIWRALIERHGAAAVPSLVFLGTGRLVDAVAAELRASAALRDKIVTISDASDEQLREAYRTCLFTVYPSLVEGWGLPVAEGLTFGKFCIASNRASLPEVAGDLIDYFDPENEAEAYARIERALFEPGYLASRTARIAAEYRPPTWQDCALELLGKLDSVTTRPRTPYR